MKIRKWWNHDELVVMIPSFDEYAEKYLASLPPKPKPTSQVAALKAEVESLKAQLAHPTTTPELPINAPKTRRGRK